MDRETLRMTTQIKHKRGDDFVLAARVTEDDGATPINLTGWTIRAQIRTSTDALVAEIDVTVTDVADGRYTLIAAGTDGWPLGVHRADIEYIDQAGRVISTETFWVPVERDETRPVAV